MPGGLFTITIQHSKERKLGMELKRMKSSGQIRRRCEAAGRLMSIFFLMAFGLASCGEKIEKDTTPPKIEIKTTEIGAVGGSQFVSVTATSAWQITVEDGDGNVNPEWISVSPMSGEGSKDVVLKVSENTSEESRTAVLRVTSEGGKAEASLTQSGAKKDNPDPQPDPTPAPSREGSITNATKWLELPSIPSDSDAFTHSMEIGSVKTRNYSFLWDYDNLVASWVAYPLCKWNISSGGRSNSWGLDPLLDEKDQPVLYRGFSEGNAGWLARGHQIPSADRLSSSGNLQTFYGTNMTPQINDRFNATIWANLETQVRSWANKSDTLYVVTGCVIDYKEGETVKYALDNVGKKVTVPTAYYKVVLRYMKNSTIGYSGYCACAVWMDHKEYDTKNFDKSYSMSVDALEEKLGIDFFVNLPSVVGEKTAATIEAEDPSKVAWWW